MKKKKINEPEEPETEEEPIMHESYTKHEMEIINMITEMKNQYNGFVQVMAKLNQRTDDILQMIIRPPEQPQDNSDTTDASKKKDSRSAGISDTMGKKLSDATLHEIIEAGDLALKVHDRRQGLTDLEEFMVGLGKNTLSNFGTAQSGAIGRKQV